METDCAHPWQPVPGWIRLCDIYGALFAIQLSYIVYLLITGGCVAFAEMYSDWHYVLNAVFYCLCAGGPVMLVVAAALGPSVFAFDLMWAALSAFIACFGAAGTGFFDSVVAAEAALALAYTHFIPCIAVGVFCFWRADLVAGVHRQLFWWGSTKWPRFCMALHSVIAILFPFFFFLVYATVYDPFVVYGLQAYAPSRAALRLATRTDITIVCIYGVAPVVYATVLGIVLIILFRRNNHQPFVYKPTMAAALPSAPLSALQFGLDDHGATIAVAPGELLVVQLPENRTTPYRWIMQHTPGLVFLSEHYIRENSDTDERTGMSGTIQWTFRVHDQPAKKTLEHVQAWFIKHASDDLVDTPPEYSLFFSRVL
jgi:predicted secreted protein